MIDTKECPICKSNKLQVLKKYSYVFPKAKESASLKYYYEERLKIFFDKILKDGSPAKFNVCMCKSCGMIFTNPRFTSDEIREKYDAISKLESEFVFRHEHPARKTEERSKRIYLLVTEYMRDSSRLNRILDYGGAEGYNLLHFLNADNTCYVIDYVQYDRPRSIQFFQGDLTVLKASETFDVILLCHVLEHATDPRAFLKALSYHLAETGLLYIEVPLGCFGEWRSLREPLTHVNFFSEQSLCECFRDSDLNIIYLSTSYQWVTHGKMWCINLLASRTKVKNIKRFKTTRQQMDNDYYRFRHRVGTIQSIPLELGSYIVSFLPTRMQTFVKESYRSMFRSERLHN